MSRYKEGDVIYVWWHGIGRTYWRKGTVVELLDDVNAMVRLDDWSEPCKCYIDNALPYRAYEIMGDVACEHIK